MEQKISQKRQNVYNDVKSTFGIVPGFIKLLPDSSIEEEWKLMKKVQMEEGPIPNKYRELIGLGVAAVMKCKYCTVFHTEAAKMNGATDSEIEDAVHFAKSSAGWSAYLNGMQVDFEQFRREIMEIGRNASHAQSEKMMVGQEA